MNSETLRKKGVMVMYAIERGLGDFVSKFANYEGIKNTKLAADIRSRESYKGNVVQSMEGLVAAAYIGELIDLAIQCTANTSINDAVRELKSTLDALSFYDIRNSVAHSNKVFPTTFWYRVAAVATDPVFDRLGLDYVKAEVELAEQGLIADPPEEWLKKRELFIVNNVPQTFDHEITGLVGRSKERKALIKAIKNQRHNFFSLVAPGGMGKTALALDVMSEVCADPSYMSVIDAVVFVSMKTEFLTASGVIKNVSASQSVADLKEEIVGLANRIFEEVDSEDFDVVLKESSTRRVLLCIDNLETLLVNGTDFLEEFVNELPSSWKVLVTTRIPVQAAYSIPLTPLDSEAALQLANIYAARQGNVSLREGDANKIIDSCSNNPLAIRLVVDSLSLGRGLIESITSSRSSVLEFSFSNLMETLSKDQVMVLESILILSSPSRYEIFEATELDFEVVSDSLNRLCRTSLVIRINEGSDDDEKYNINSALREYLVSNVANLSVRKEIAERISKKKSLAKEILHTQRERGASKTDAFYIPENLSENLQVVVYKVFNAIKNKKQSLYADCHRQLSALSVSYDGDAFYHRAYALLLHELDDHIGAEEHYRKSLSINPDDVVTNYLLAKHFFERREYDRSFEIYDKLKEMGYWSAEKTEERFSRRLCAGYFFSLLYQNKYDEVLELTKPWKEGGHLRALLGTIRASAHKRSVEVVVTTDPDKGCEGLKSAVRILADVFKTNGYQKEAVNEAKKIFDEIVYLIERHKVKDRALHDEWVDFLDNHLEKVCSIITKEPSLLQGYVKSIQSAGRLFVPAFFRPKWLSVNDPEGQSRTYSFDKSYARLTVVAVPFGKDYCFANNEQGEKHFCHFKRIHNASDFRLRRLSEGDQLAAKVRPERKEGESLFVETAWLIDQ